MGSNLQEDAKQKEGVSQLEHAKTTELSCEPSTIHLDLPLDPAAWTSQDLAQSLRLDGLVSR